MAVLLTFSFFFLYLETHYVYIATCEKVKIPSRKKYKIEKKTTFIIHTLSNCVHNWDYKLWLMNPIWNSETWLQTHHHTDINLHYCMNYVLNHKWFIDHDSTINVATCRKTVSFQYSISIQVQLRQRINKGVRNISAFLVPLS